MRSTKKTYVTENLPIPHPKHNCRNRAADWEEDGVKRGMMPNPMPIPHIFEMIEIIPTSRTTNNSGRRVLTGGPDVRDSQARSNDISHG